MIFELAAESTTLAARAVRNRNLANETGAFTWIRSKQQLNALSKTQAQSQQQLHRPPQPQLLRVALESPLLQARPQ
jgi:hypothetical protein